MPCAPTSYLAVSREMWDPAPPDVGLMNLNSLLTWLPSYNSPWENYGVRLWNQSKDAVSAGALLGVPL
jgi:hypothetical protein